MAFSVAGKHALITGAGSGINLAFARLLLQRGCSVTIGDIGLQPGAEELLRQYPHTAGSNSKKPAAIFHKTDVSSWPQLSSLWARATSAFPTVDIVCPGAGIFEPSWSSFWEPPVTVTNPNSPSRDRADAAPGTYATIDVCLTHPIRLSQLALGYWLAEQNKGKAAAAGGTRGVLLHVSSIAGHSTSIGTPLYYASKHGLHAFVRSLGSLRDTVGVRVGAVAPCGVKVTVSPILAENRARSLRSIVILGLTGQLTDRNPRHRCGLKILRRLLCSARAMTWPSPKKWPRPCSDCVRKRLWATARFWRSPRGQHV